LQSVCAAARAGGHSDHVGASKENEHETIRINADEAIWRNSMVPERILNGGWLPTGTLSAKDMLSLRSGSGRAAHNIVAPATGRLAISAPILAVIDPGFLLATLMVDAEA
jgi:hypothetical protein